MTIGNKAKHIALSAIFVTVIFTAVACLNTHTHDAVAAQPMLPIEHSQDSHHPRGAGAMVVEGEGRRCSYDRHCSGYLRCQNEQCSIPPAMTGQVDINTPQVAFYSDDTLDSQVATFYAELAVSPYEQTRGLMYRPSMHDDWGMLFIYSGDLGLSFWMKNTHIALDMIFIDSSGKIVGIIESAEPHSTIPRPTPKPARYVLEINAGVAQLNGLEIGQFVVFENIPIEHHPIR